MGTGKADGFQTVSTLGRASKKKGAPSSRGIFGLFGWLIGSWYWSSYILSPAQGQAMTCVTLKAALCLGQKSRKLHSILGEGNGTPLQYSCLESPMDGGAWYAAVHGVAKSRTRLSDFTFTFYFHALGKEMATHSSILAWIIPGIGEPGGLPSMGSHRVGHDWSDLAAAFHSTPFPPPSSNLGSLVLLFALLGVNPFWWQKWMRESENCYLILG